MARAPPFVQEEFEMAKAHPPEVLASNLFQLTMLGVGAVIAAMVFMSFVV